ncbi:hypothetical protein [Stenotrophomonas sp. 278]|uniref:hypothetical protein n=1 Tax=Stenotrophomonas sp. 278 TaxID=2479851 RepID=UPI000F689EF8|nr:hypothetical protein [Stenotrophomonas sp. 278]RRU23530.1 hypothetical protein EGJ34_03130 [Stenotrophomonas sp. 278]
MKLVVAPAESALTRIKVYESRYYDAGASYLYLNETKLIIRPDDSWLAHGSCLQKVLAGWREGRVLCADVIFTDEPQQTAGSVILSHWKTNLPCTFAVPKSTVARRQYHSLDVKEGDEDHDNPWGPCSANTTHSLQLENAPSAVRILLTDDPGCDKDMEGNEFWIELRTTAKSVTFNAIPLDELMTYQPGSIVRPGLQLVGSYLMHGKSAQRNLGCAKVTTSAAPPAP